MNTLRLLREQLPTNPPGIASAMHNVPLAIVVCAAYFAGAKVGLELTLHPQPISVLWPPNAIMMGFLLVTPIRRWPVLVLAALPAHFVAELQEGVPIAMVACWFVTNMIEAIIGAYLLLRLQNGVPQLGTLNDVRLFIICATIVAPFFSSFIDVTCVRVTGWSQEPYWQMWRTRVFSNALANLTIVPAVVTAYAVATGPWTVITRSRVVEGLALLSSLVTATFIAFNSSPVTPGALPALLFVPLPFLLWAGMRFGPAGSSVAFMTVALVVIWGASHGRGPFVSSITTDAALPVQLFLIFVGATLLVLTGAIEERRSTEQKLRSSERRFALAFRANPEAIAISRAADNTVVDVNERWLSMFGYGRDDVIGRTERQLGVYPADAESRDSIDMPGQPPTVRERELRMKTRNGVNLRAIVSRETVELDGTKCFITIIHDVTELKRAIDSLRRNDERTQLVLKATSDVIYDWNIAIDRLWWNDNGGVYFGKWSEIDENGLERWSLLLHPEDKDRVTSEIKKFIEHREEVIDAEYRLQRLDGTYAYVHGRALILRSASGKPLRMIGSLMDITDRKRAEDANLQLVHVSRLAVLGEMTASIAHEINQPLGAILSNTDSAEILLNEPAIRVDELRQIVNDIRSDGLRAGEVIRHIRDLLRKRKLTMRPFDLNRAIGDVISLVSADLNRHRVVVDTEFQPLPVVIADEVHVQQIVLNLIFNAVDAMANAPLSGRRLWIRTARPKTGVVEVSIADSGQGIAPDYAERLFESFFTTKENGMGLGLAIARSIVDAHGGTIWAESRNEGGAIFRFSLPSSPAKHDSAAMVQ